MGGTPSLCVNISFSVACFSWKKKKIKKKKKVWQAIFFLYLKVALRTINKVLLNHSVCACLRDPGFIEFHSCWL